MASHLGSRGKAMTRRPRDDAKETLVQKIVDLDHASGSTQHGYHLVRIVRIGPYTVRVRVERDSYPHRCRAAAAVLSAGLTWTQLVDDHTGSWTRSTPSPGSPIDPDVHLGPVADVLLCRAAEVLPEPEHGVA